MTAAARPQYLDCPDCAYPLDPAAAPRHPSHDISDEELATLARNDEAREARDEARRWAAVRAEERRARRAAAKARRRR